MSGSGKKRILCTTEAVADLIKEIGKDNVKTLPLIWGEHDPHSYQLVKGDSEKFDYADLIFCSGLDLEHGQSLHKKLSESKKTRSLGDFIAHKYPHLIIIIDGTVDPHIWMDANLWSKSIPYIVDELSILMQEHKESIKENGEVFSAKLKKLHKNIVEQFKAFKGGVIVF